MVDLYDPWKRVDELREGLNRPSAVPSTQDEFQAQQMIRQANTNGGGMGGVPVEGQMAQLEAALAGQEAMEFMNPSEYARRNTTYPSMEPGVQRSARRKRDAHLQTVRDQSELAILQRDRALQEQEREEQMLYMQQRDQLMKIVQRQDPGIDDETAAAAAAQVIAGNADLSDFVPEAPKDIETEVFEEIRDGEKVRVMYNSQTGAEVKVLGPVAPEDDPDLQSRDITQPDGSVVTEYYHKDNPGVVIHTVLKKPPEQPTDSSKEFNAMPGTDRTKVGLISNAAAMWAKSFDKLFDPKTGDFNRVYAFGTTEGRDALKNLETATRNGLRTESGATIGDQEQSDEEELSMPTWHDSTKAAQGKTMRAYEKLLRIHTALTSGYNKVPDINQFNWEKPVFGQDQKMLNEQFQSEMDRINQ